MARTPFAAIYDTFSVLLAGTWLWQHSQEVGSVCFRVSEALRDQFPEEYKDLNSQRLYRAGVLHDIGLIPVLDIVDGVGSTLFTSPEDLEELKLATDLINSLGIEPKQVELLNEVLKAHQKFQGLYQRRLYWISEHPVRGYRWISSLLADHALAELVLYHHCLPSSYQRSLGEGYPQEFCKTLAIYPPSLQVLQMVEVFQSYIHPSYGFGHRFAEGLNLLRVEAGLGRWDVKLANRVCSILEGINYDTAPSPH